MCYLLNLMLLVLQAYTQNQEAFNPFSSYTPFHQSLQDPAFPRTPSDPFARRPYRASQDSMASTFMHADGRRSVDDRPSMDSARSGFGSPPVESSLNAYSSRGGNSLFAFGSGVNQQQQHGAFGRQSSGGLHQGPFNPSAPPPLGSGRGLETMPEDDDPRVSHFNTIVCWKSFRGCCSLLSTADTISPLHVCESRLHS